MKGSGMPQKFETPIFRPFNELVSADVDFDFHMHTTQTDGNNSLDEMVGEARKKGLRAIAITEHVNRGCPWYKEFADKVFAIRNQPGMKIYLGIEAKPLDFEGTLDASDDVMEIAELVIGSVHRYPDGKGGLIPLNDVEGLGEEKASRIEFDLAMGLIKNRANRVDVLGHPLGVFSRVFHVFKEEYLARLMEACKERGMAFEISTKYCSDLPRLIGMLKEINPPVSIGSDAHGVQDIAKKFAVVKEGTRKCL